MLFGSSGIRRRYDASLINLAVRVGSAVALSHNDIVVGRDARTTGPVLASAFISGVLSSGGDITYGGIAPTPTVAYATKKRSAGCMITASHNPEPYNGMKLVNPDGSAFTKVQQKEVEEQIHDFHWSDWANQGCTRETDIITPHMDAILDSVSIESDISVVLDCGNGAGSVITPELLASAGVKTHCLNCNLSGRFARPSEPLESNLSYVGGLVRSLGSDCALIHDGDADRFMAFDNKGRYISGDHLLILFAEYLGAEKVVTTVDASMAIEEVAEVHRTPVGDSYVSEELLSWGEFGGEPSGSWLFPNHSLCPDGIYAAALFCRIASEWNIADEIDNLPNYPIIRESFPCDDPHALLSALGAENPTDGIRLSDEDGWCLIRASGTEPKVRITAEGRTGEVADRMAEKGRSLLKTREY